MGIGQEKPVRVFISYCHESDEYSKNILGLADHLRRDGIDCRIDQYVQFPPEGWPRWMEEQIRTSNYVLIVCSELYEKRVQGNELRGIGRGIRFESLLTYQEIYENGSLNIKFIPILLKPEHVNFIPGPLKAFQYYLVSSKEGYEELFRRISNQPLIVPPDIGKDVKKFPTGINNSSPSDTVLINQFPNKLLQARKPRLSNRTVLIGREKEQNELRKYLLDRETSIVIVSGMTGMGKSALVDKTTDSLRAKFDDILPYDLKDSADFHSILHKLGQVAISHFLYKGEPDAVKSTSNLTLKEVLPFILDYLTEKKLLLIFDSFENLLDKRRGEFADESILAFFELFTKFERSTKICLVTQVSPQFVSGDIRKIKELPPLQGLNLRSIEQLLKSFRLKQINRSKANEFARLLGGNPQVLLLFYKNNKHRPIDEMLRLASAVHKSLDEVLNQVEAGLETLEKKTLHYLSVFRQPPTYNIFFGLFGDSPETYEALNVLQSRGLLATSPDMPLIRMHQSLRQYFSNKINAETRLQIHQAIGRSLLEEVKRLQNIEADEVKLLLESIYHLRQANDASTVQSLVRNLLKFFPEECNYQDLENIFNLSQDLIEQQDKSLFFQRWAETLEKVGAWQRVTEMYLKTLELLAPNKIRDRAYLYLKLSQAYIIKSLDLKAAKEALDDGYALIQQMQDNDLMGFYRLCSAYYLSYNNKRLAALDILKENISESFDKKNNPDILGDSFRIAGVIQKDLLFNDKSVEMLSKAVEIFESIHSDYFLSMAQHNLASTYQKKNKYDLARMLLEKSIAVKKRIGDVYGLARCHRGLAKIYTDQKTYDKAENEIHKGMELRKQLGDTEGIALDKQQLAFIEERRGNWIKSRQYLEEVHSFFLYERPNKSRVAEIINTFGISYFSNNEYNRALESFLDASVKFSELGDTFHLATCYQRIGQCYFFKGNSEDAKVYLIKAIELLPSEERPAEYAQAQTVLGQIYKNMNAHQEAKECFEKADKAAPMLNKK